jgi:hypothetical protein
MRQTGMDSDEAPSVFGFRERAGFGATHSTDVTPFKSAVKYFVV